ncbi:MAG: hypothetical protein H6564_03385 [Lewinellaceae bacterium]|nr:hypothetical protein [Lewinellaceae bacterium]
MEDKNGNLWLGCAGGLYCLRACLEASRNVSHLI